MVNIVQIALRKPLTFIVMAVVILIAGTIAAFRTPVDMFPDIRIPVVAVAFTYTGLSPEDVAGRIVTPYERTVATTVSNIEHSESQSLPGIGIIKLFFQPGADIRIANAQVTALSQTTLKSMPPGETPPMILNYSASTVPIVQFALAGKGLSEQQTFDTAQNQIRPMLATVAGASIPNPYGGRQRQVQVDIDQQAMQAHGLTAPDIGAALAAQSQINPAGFAKIGSYQYNVRLNNAPASVEAMNDLPVKQVNGSTVYMRDVAHVRDGSSPQTNVVHVDGSRSVLMAVMKNGATSTLSIVNDVKEAIERARPLLPPALQVVPVGDQSLFVKAAVSGVVREGAVAALLTSLMVLLVLGSWRSTVIIAVSIPLSVLAAIAALHAFGETLNVMTLGGLALAVGILVDDATVTIENINWHLERGKGVVAAITDGAAQIVVPAFVSLLCICIVFVPMFFLPGVAGYLFVPMALSVIFAMIASFLLSRTLVPTMAMYLLRPHAPGHDHAAGPARSRNLLVRFQHGFEQRFEALRDGYGGLLRRALAARGRFLSGFLAVVLLSGGLLPLLGRDFFPSVDAGQILLHVRAPVGSRIEVTSTLFQHIAQRVRQVVPPDEVASITDNIGMSYGAIGPIYNNSGTIGSQDGDMLILLAKDHGPTANHVEALRRDLPRTFPQATFAFLPADITSQVLNFGAPAPIDIQVSGNDAQASARYTARLLRQVRAISGLADARLQQSARLPQINVTMDRSRLAQYNLSARDVTNSLSASLAGTGQTAPTYLLNGHNGVSYPVVAQTPEQQLTTVGDIANLPVAGGGGGAGQVLGGISTFSRAAGPALITHYNIAPTLNIYATPAGRDLGSVTADIRRAIAALDGAKPKGITVTLRGQSQTMDTAFRGLGLGLIGAIVLIYLLIVINFQSWVDPFVIITALPAALAGIGWLLFATGTTLSVPALTGAIMCMGVATANSILVVSFARERLQVLGDAAQAALEAGTVRFRPVLMTALAMIIGMLPMAMSLGEGGEQNAPLGRAVIGGLIGATIATLFFVPAVFSLVHRNHRRTSVPAFHRQPTYA